MVGLTGRSIVPLPQSVVLGILGLTNYVCGRLWGNAETAVTIIAASIPMLRVMIRDATNSRRAYGTADSYKENGLGSSKRNMRVVTISSSPMRSDVEMAKQINDDDSDKGILEDSQEAMKMGRIVKTNDFEIKYDTRRDYDVER